MNLEDIVSKTPIAVRKPERERDLLSGPLIDLAIKGLVNMFDDEKKLFCYRVRKTADGLEKEGTSYRYTIISLLGFYKYESQGMQSPINIQDTLKALVERSGEINNVGDLGLLLWLCGLAAPGLITRIFENSHLKWPLSQYHDAVQGKTMEVAWFLTGLTYVSLANCELSNPLQKITLQVYDTLRNNYGRRGIFGHQKKTTLSGMIRGRIGSFADQVYPIYALSKFGKVYDNKEALRIARECGNAICGLQGPNGQWWWHYDSSKGRVIGRYPVYTVHQDGMAPMALFALSEATGHDFCEPVYKGLRWITGKNELGFDFVDAAESMIWRNAYRKTYKRYSEEILSLLHLNSKPGESKDLLVLFEDRPYHLGWILYAFADKN